MAGAPKRFGQRHVLVILAHLGLAVVYGMRANLSVALVAMVNDTNEVAWNESSEETCPRNIVPTNESDTPDVVGEFSWSRELQGIILSSFFWGYLVTQIPGGILAQRFGGKWVFGLGIAWTAVLTLLTPVAARLSPYCLIVLRVLMGLGEGVTYPALTAMMGFWVPRGESTFLFAAAYSGGQLGTILGQLTAGPLCASSWGWPSVFYVNGVVAVVWLLPWCCLVSEKPSTHGRISAAERDYIQNTAAVGSDAARSCLSLPWRKILTDPAIWAYTLCIFVNSWKFFTLLTCLPQFLSDVLHFDIKSDGMISTLPYVGNFFVQFFASWLADRVIASGRLSRTATRKIFTTVGLGSVVVFMIAAVYTGCNVAATVAMLIIMLTIGAFDLGGFSPNPLDLSPECCGTISGLANTFGISAGIIAPIVTDTITKHHSRREWAIVFYLTSAIAAVGVITFAIFGSGNRRYWFIDEEQESLCDSGDDGVSEDGVNEVA